MNLSQHLAANLIQLRRAKAWSQQRLAERSGVARSSIAHMESGDGNPALGNLAAVSTALRVSIEELLSTPRAACTHVPAPALRRRQQGAGVTVVELLPERVRGLEIVRLELQPKATMLGSPHLRGSHEYLHVLSGTMAVAVSGDRHQLSAGDVLAFPGDVGHSYANRGSGLATAVSVVVPAGTA